MNYDIKFDELKTYLETLDRTDFEKNDKIEKGHTIQDIEHFKVNKQEIKLSQFIDYGTPFLVDIIGSDLSVVINTRKKYRSPNGRVVKAKFVKTIIPDCHKQYGTALNGYWMIPDKFLTKIK